MQQFKAPILPFAHQRDALQRKGDGLRGQMICGLVQPSLTGFGVQPPREGHVKAEIIQHVRVAPRGQVRILTGRQTGRAAAGKLCFGRGRTELIKVADKAGGELRQESGVANRRQRQKPAEHRQLQATGLDWRNRSGACGDSRFQIVPGTSLCQPKRRFDRAVKSVFPGCHRDVIKPCQRELIHRRPGADIPAQPSGPEICEPGILRDRIKRKASM